MFRTSGRFACSLPLLFACAVSVLASPEPAAPTPATFRAVDTSRLLGSPDPLPPLEVVRAFPKLKFDRPVAIANAGDGSNRLFVCEQRGIIRAFENRDDVDSSSVFLDLRDRAVYEHFEEGLLGLAFDPKFPEVAEFYVYYSTRTPGEDGNKKKTSVVARFRLLDGDASRGDPASEERLLEIDEPFGNHNGGAIEFGPDGMLYIGLGDGGKRDDPFGHGQNLSTLLGTVLRIDVHQKSGGKEYSVPADNPFVATEGARPEIWAYGIRNPWRISFDRLTGDLWLADVGQDKWEEINLIRPGGNYGWKIREGRHDWKPDAPRTGTEFVEPIWEYPRDEGKSITGGYVYRGELLPELYGAYIYGDFVTFNLWALRYDGEKVSSNHLIARSNLPITAFGEDEAGEVYLAALESDRDTTKLDLGTVFRLDQGGLYRFRRRQSEDVRTEDFPRLLSETGLFSDLKSMTPAPGLIPYDVAVPLWSDGTDKIRYLALPAGGTIDFDAKGAWSFPVGTVFVKTFTLDSGKRRRRAPRDHRLETRLLVHAARGWEGYTYLWNDERTDARLLDAALTRSYPVSHGGRDAEAEWYFPSRSDCRACHTQSAGFVLGVTTRQLNFTTSFADFQANQLAALERLGVFSEALPDPGHLDAYPVWGDRSAPVEKRARAYLDANCAMCHAPGGTGLSKADLRFNTPLDRAALIDAPPGQGRIGSAESRLIVPGSPQESELLHRMLKRGAGQMPTLASSKIDWEAARVIGEWIESLR